MQDDFRNVILDCLRVIIVNIPRCTLLVVSKREIIVVVASSRCRLPTTHPLFSSSRFAVIYHTTWIDFYTV